MKRLLLALGCVFAVMSLTAQINTNNNKFKQLYEELPTPNNYRNASGAPGHEYFQQRADYTMNLRIDDDKQQLHGQESIKYYNNSPDKLSYLWLQLDQNVRAKDSESHLIRESNIDGRTSINSLNRLIPSFDGGFKIDHVKGKNGQNLKYTIIKTMMRIDLPKALGPNETFEFDIKWWYNINNTRKNRGRSGYEPFAEDGNNVYVIAQYFPRLCAYNDVDGWQNKQFLGRGEFTLIFGNYDVKIEVPADHLVSSTGVLQNPDKVLSSEQKTRLKRAAKELEQPMMIATREEADERMKGKKTNTKTWHYKAENVRDFAFATSRRFIWDAMGVKMDDGRTVMAMSMWTKEGDCIWKKYSTKAVAHTIKWYSHYTIDYPYPVAWSIDGNMGMEYPMISFNFGRCEDDDTYTQRTKYGHIGVIIHEVGHNWFPMIINSDERQWTWMDEGLNSFVQFLTEQHWERNHPSRRGKAHKIVDYMKGDKNFISPIMTNSESIHQFGNNAYGKPATALNILRETVMGREAFDHAFKEYCERWAFKQPMPADFFRTMEDASGIDLDWFWRGWFYTNDHVDQSIASFKPFELTDMDPLVAMEAAKKKRDMEPVDITILRNNEAIKQTLNEKDPSINDFYTNYDPLEPSIIDEQEYAEYFEGLSPEEQKLVKEGKNFYELKFENVGGLMMPIVFDFIYEDGTKETFRIPAEVWKLNHKAVTKVFPTDKKVVEVILDPYLETADTDRGNNYYPKRQETDRFDLFKKNKTRTRENPMQRNNRAKKLENSRL